MSATAEAPPTMEHYDSAELYIEGDQLTFEVGGKAPTTSSLTLTGGKIDVPGGGYEKGTRLSLVVECVIDDVGFKDLTDTKTGQVVGCQRRHKARIVGIAKS